VPTRSADGQYASALNIGGAGGLQSGPRMPNCMATPSSNLQETSSSTLRSRFMSKLPSKRSMRAPRMRWNSRLHQHFVHAVELLGGHESNALSLSPSHPSCLFLCFLLCSCNTPRNITLGFSLSLSSWSESSQPVFSEDYKPAVGEFPCPPSLPCLPK
jgi:hypothetical protein